MDVRDGRDGHQERHANEGEPRERVQRIRHRCGDEIVPRDREREDADEGCEARGDEQRREHGILGLHDDREEHEREHQEDVDPETDRLERPVRTRCTARDGDEDLGRNHGPEVPEEVGPPGDPNGLHMGRRDRRGHDYSRGCPRKGSEGTASYACRASKYKYGVAATWPNT